MPYPDELLVAGERVLTHQHPHPKMLVLPALVFLVTVGGAAYLAALIAPAPWATYGFWALGLVAVVLIGWCTVAPLLRWSNTHFVLTRSGFEIPMNRITSVRFRQTMFERMLGCGTLSVESASEEPLDFSDIPSVTQVYGLLYEAADGGW